MEATILYTGIYAAVSYKVIEKNGMKYIALEAHNVAIFLKAQANMRLLDDIGDKDPDDVMTALFASMPKPK